MIIVDGAGTLFDPGSVVPAYAFQEEFSEKGLDLPMDIVLKYMGMGKKDHIRLMLNEPDVQKQFVDEYNRNPNEKDVELFYQEFKSQLYPCAAKTLEIPGAKEAAFKLKEKGIKLALTTGYDRKMFEETRKKLPWLSKVVDYSVTNSEVIKGRPAPYMIHHAMEAMLIDNPSWAIKLGDTKVDLEAADNAHMPGILVMSGSVSNTEDAKKINAEIGRDHMLSPSLKEVVDYILDGTIVERTNLLSCTF